MSTPMRSRGSREGSFGSSKVVVSERGQNMKTVLLGTIFPFAGAGMVGAIVVGDGSGAGAATGAGDGPAGVVRTNAQNVALRQSSAGSGAEDGGLAHWPLLTSVGIALVAVLAAAGLVIGRTGGKRS